MTETLSIGFMGFQIMATDGQDKSMFFKILTLSKKLILDISVGNKC